MTSEFSPTVRTWSEMTFFESPSRSKLCLEHDPSGQARGQAFSESRYPARIKSGPGFFGIMLLEAPTPPAGRIWQKRHVLPPFPGRRPKRAPIAHEPRPELTRRLPVT